jgi:hypothetical protein
VALLPPRHLHVGLEWYRALLGTGIGASGLHAADLDGDGAAEIVAAATESGHGGSRFWYVLAHDGSGYSHRFASFLYPGIITSVTTANLDGDGDEDVIIGHDGGILAYDGLTFAMIGSLPAGGPVLGLTVLDVDSDGVLEYLHSDGSSVLVHDTTTGELEHTIAAADYGNFAVGNVDDDADLEIIIPGLAGGRIINGRTMAEEWNYGITISDYVRAADVDGDGRDEIVEAKGYYAITVLDAELESTKYQITLKDDIDALRLIDLDGDRVAEILVGDDDFGGIYAYRGSDGNLLWHHASQPGDSGITDIAAGDTDGDGAQELIWGTGFSTTGPDHLLVHSVVTLAREWSSTDLTGPISAIDHGDIDDDFAPELLYGLTSSESPEDDSLVFFHDAATKVPEYQSTRSTGLDWSGMARIRHANLDGDPQQEYCITTSYTHNGLIICYDGISHAEEWRTSELEGLFFSSLAIADIDDSGSVEVVAGTRRQTGDPVGNSLYVYDGATGVELWHTGTLGSHDGPLALLRIGNIDGDAQLELVVSEPGGGVYSFDGLTRLPEFALESLDAGALELHDVDLDGRAEILLGTRTGEIAILDPSTGLLTPAVSGPGPGVDALAIEDLTGDGVADYVLAAGDEVRIHDGASPSTELWNSGVIGSGVGALDSILVADVDEDGKVEIVVNVGPTGLAVFEVPLPCVDDGSMLDCNANANPDNCDISYGYSGDCDLDGVPDDCQDDSDTDGIIDGCDTCVDDANPHQSDGDGDGAGDACDVCALVHDPGQEDLDDDGTGDACDVCPGAPDPFQADADVDGRGDACDNCQATSNTGQEDLDGDGAGDACDIWVAAPLNRDTLDCSDPATLRPTISWDPGQYANFKVFMGTSPAFEPGSSVTSGKRRINGTFWIPSRKNWRRACRKAFAADAASPVLYIQVRGTTRMLPRRDPARMTLSDLVLVELVR